MEFPNVKKYKIVYADPPWSYYGDPNKNAAAGKHYHLMSNEEIFSLPIRSIMEDDAALFLWATSPKLDTALEAIKSWGLFYRGVAFVWVKTRKDGGIINAQGITPTFTKPTTEFLLVATTKPKGRPFPIFDLKMGQVVLCSRLEHSQKPDVFRQKIVQLCGDIPRIELFARNHPEGWDVWGNETEKFKCCYGELPPIIYLRNKKGQFRSKKEAFITAYKDICLSEWPAQSIA